jgi:hypothetical protein
MNVCLTQAPSAYPRGDSKERFYKESDGKVIKWGMKKLQNYNVRRNVLIDIQESQPR